MVKINDRDPEWKLKTLEEQYNLIIIEQKLLFDLTSGKINLFKTGSVAKTSVQLWYDIVNPPKPAPILSYESDIFESCYNGALIWAIPYTGYGYKYDICSEYPSILRNDKMQWPIDQEELTTILNIDCVDIKFFKYGSYRAKIYDADYRLLKTNSKKWYTHTDLNRGLELAYKIELIEDENSNALLYKQFVNGAKLFRPFFDYLFPYKKAGHKCFKKYMNTLHGALCQSDKTTINTSKNEIVYEDKEIMSMRPMGNNLDDMFSEKLKMDVYKKDKFYECDYARIKPFLVAKGRYMISKIIEKNLDNVVHCHTDGIILKNPIDSNQKLGNDIGDLNFECEGQCVIKNATDFKFI